MALAAPPALIYAVDDDPSVLRSIARTLRAAGYAVETFARPAALLERGLGDHPACVVLDLRMPEMTGLELQQALRGLGDPTIVFVSGHADVPTAVAAMKEGAVDFLSKPFDDVALLAAVARAVERDGSARADRGQRDQSRARFAALAPQEQKVLRLVAAGLLNKQIAADIGLSEATVRNYRNRATHKLGVTSVPELVRLLADVDVG